MEKKYNLRSPAVKRLMREAKELHQATELYYAQPLEDNLFEWHFTVRGPPDTEFAGGRYHGRITLPPEYPMKPPSIMLLTPNGRFEIGKKICLSMSAHHPETWQPSWSIRTVLMAIIGFMPSKGAGAIGALDYSPKERSALAKKSAEWKCSVCGSCNSNALLDEGSDSTKTKEDEQEIAEIAGQIAFKEEDKKKEDTSTSISTSPQSTPNTGTNDVGATPPIYPTQIPMSNPWMGYQQQYMAYNPYYMTYGFNYPGVFGGQAPVGEPILTENANQNQSTNQSTDANINQPSNQEATNQNSVSNSTESSVRQRTVTSQQGPQNQPAHAPTVNAAVQQHSMHAGMASLIVMWLVAVSIIALVLRRIFIE
ncbi:ubiquitin-conjugating enzyme E2 J1-like [Actinia tenebrosa]|uniref:Ubiquitin-conjugating enzyme E2 J1-like n=1 Tax=Actinia tenebrosa TaxID=6105 RepID=A0A6P8I8P4_ACTTE|nr:ubiquitin-conjugating enzyme E2 J1-like [Actinia tenebrosa]